jgi:hypothetical protein
MIIDWSTKDIKAQVDRIAWAESDPKMDGFVTWRCKQDLYELYWHLEDKLEKCSKYVGEQEFVEYRREQKIVNKMSGIK